MIGGVDLQGGKVEKWLVTFNLTPENAEFVLKDIKQNVVTPENRGGVLTYKIKTGIYYYTANADKYISKEDVRVAIYEETTIDVILQKEVEIVPFSTATDEQIEKMLNAHYNGEIDISEYWKVR